MIVDLSSSCIVVRRRLRDRRGRLSTAGAAGRRRSAGGADRRRRRPGRRDRPTGRGAADGACSTRHRPVERRPSSRSSSRSSSARSATACRKARAALAGAFTGVRGRSGDHRRDLGRPRGGAAARRRRRRRHHRAARRAARRVKAKEITEPDAAARRPARRDEGPARPAPTGRCTSRPPTTAARTCGCSSASTASARRPRSARSPTSRWPTGRIGAAGRRRHVPRRRRRAARHVGRAGRRRARARQRGRRPERRHLRRRRAGRRRATSTSCWPTPPGACTPRPT